LGNPPLQNSTSIFCRGGFISVIYGRHRLLGNPPLQNSTSIFCRGGFISVIYGRHRLLGNPPLPEIYSSSDVTLTRCPMGIKIAVKINPTATLNARITPTGNCIDSKVRNLIETGVAFWTETIAIALIPTAKIRQVKIGDMIFIGKRLSNRTSNHSSDRQYITSQ
jgi:hypothetical protein